MADNVPATSKPLAEAQTVRDMLRHPSAEKQLARVAASMVDPGRMLRTITMDFQRNPLLAECAPMSFLGSMMTAASLGLMPNTPLGECYLVPFRNTKLSRKFNRDVYEVQLIIGYRGYEKLARRSGGLVSIHADIATAKEWEAGEFDYQYGTGQFLKHRAIDPDGDPMWAYAHAQLKDGQAFIVWPYSKVLAHRDRFSQAYQRARAAAKDKSKEWILRETPWVKHEGAMVRKTMIRQLASRLDLTIEGEQALSVDEARNLNFAKFALTQNVGPGDIPEPMPEEPEEDEEIEDAETADEPEPKAEPESKGKKATSGAQGKGGAGKAGSGKGAGAAGKKAAPEAADGPSEGKAKSESKPKAEPKKGQDAEGEGEGEGLFGRQPTADDAWTSLADRIVGELGEAETADGVVGVLGEWEERLKQMQKEAPGHYERVDEAQNAAMDRISRGGT